jgi:DNA-binding NtrC family response regulator
MVEARRSNGDLPHILIVEDEFFVAMDLAEILEAEGFIVLGPVASVAQALELLRHETPDAAVLDVVLRGGERVTPVARLLSAMAVPFVLASAQAPQHLSQERVLTEAVNLGKPLTPQMLTRGVRRMLAH